MELSRTDHQVSPPLVSIPRHYNAAHDLIAGAGVARDFNATDVDPALRVGRENDLDQSGGPIHLGPRFYAREGIPKLSKQV